MKDYNYSDGMMNDKFFDEMSFDLIIENLWVKYRSREKKKDNIRELFLLRKR